MRWWGEGRGVEPSALRGQVEPAEPQRLGAQRPLWAHRGGEHRRGRDAGLRRVGPWEPGASGELSLGGCRRKAVGFGRVSGSAPRGLNDLHLYDPEAGRLKQTAGTADASEVRFNSL